MKVSLTYNHQLPKDELQLATQAPSPTIDRIVDFAQKEIFQLPAQVNNRKVLVDLVTIQQIYAANKKVYCYANHQEYLLNQRLYQLASTLPNSFVQISRSELIQLKYVQSFNFTKTGIIEIFFKDGRKTSASRRYLGKIKEAINHA